MKDVRITRTSNGVYDIILENGKFKWAEDGTEAAQHALIRLMIFKGEWYLDADDTMGTAWYQTIFDMSKGRAEKELEIKKRILGTTGIRKIQTFTWEQTAHSVTIEGIVETDWGSVDISQEIEPL